MLHILLCILKIIGIILAAILGILVLLVCIVLFVPIRYTVSAESSGTLASAKARVTVTWLMHLLKITACYEEKKMNYQIRIAWKKIGQKKEEENYEENKKEHVEEVEESDPPVCEGVEGDQKKASEEPGLPEKPEQKVKESKKTAKESKNQKTQGRESKEEGHPDTRPFYEKITDKIKCTILRFCDKIKELIQKKDRIMEFIRLEMHQKAWKQLQKGVVRLLKQCIPKRFRADICFGLGDPYRTGQALAVFSIMYPFLGGNIQITPDFEQLIVKGTLFIRGRLYMKHMAWLLLKLICSKEIRGTYKDYKNFKW